jgi:hypothetical protein
MSTERTTVTFDLHLSCRVELDYPAQDHVLDAIHRRLSHATQKASLASAAREPLPAWLLIDDAESDNWHCRTRRRDGVA